MARLEKGDCVRFKYRADAHETGVYEGHVVGLGERRIIIQSGQHKAHIEDADDIVCLVKKNDPDIVHQLGERLRLSGNLGGEPVREINE